MFTLEDFLEGGDVDQGRCPEELGHFGGSDVDECEKRRGDEEGVE